MAESSENSTKKKRGNPQNLIPWKPGQSGNPKGRQLGQRNRRSVILDAIKRMAKAKNMSPDELEEAIQAVGLVKAVKGSYFHYEAISDGLYGKMTDKTDVRLGGKTIADLIATATHAGRKPRSKAKAKVSE